MNKIIIGLSLLLSFSTINAEQKYNVLIGAEGKSFSTEVVKPPVDPEETFEGCRYSRFDPKYKVYDHIGFNGIDVYDFYWNKKRYQIFKEHGSSVIRDGFRYTKGALKLELTSPSGAKEFQICRYKVN